MVFCRGCGKEIHESAPTCPLCGALQPGVARAGSGRSVGRLVLWSAVWVCVFWVVSLFVVGFVAGALNPADAESAGDRMGEALAGPLLLIALLVSGALTYLGKLPGTQKGAA